MADIEIDSAGVKAVLNSGEVAAMCNAAAQAVASSVSARTDGADVVVDNYTTDRAAASVTVRDVRARAWVARDGLLIRDAAAAGLEVTAR